MKKTIILGALALSITSLSGCVELLTFLNDTEKNFLNDTEKNPCADKEIGDAVGGGFIFQLPDVGNGNTCKVVAPKSTEVQLQWGCYGTSIPDAHSDTDGAANTAAIVAACTTDNIAAKHCSDLTQGNFNDWYLPAKDELYQVYLNKPELGEFQSDWYWSSTENSATNAWDQNFVDGGQSNIGKNLVDDYVRCIRAFTD